MIYFIVGFIVLLVGALYLFPLIEVVGDSMYPTYKNGEIVVGRRLFRKSSLKKGDVVVYYNPTDQSKRRVIKRIDSVTKDKGNILFYCLGDNAEESYDSRYYGFFSSNLVICKIVNQRGKVE